MALSTNQITSITSGPRQSNFELLRIIAMAMVLGLHFNFKYSGIPSIQGVNGDLLVDAFRCLMECLCLPAVNVFILISGWFSIRATRSGLIAYLYQCFFFLILTYLIYLWYTENSFSAGGILSCFALTKYGWFIVSYLILYLLTPFVNSYINSSSSHQIKLCLIALFSVSMLYGWIGGNSNYNNGYTAVSFIGLYILGRYLSIYCILIPINWVILFIVSTGLNFFLIFLDTTFFKCVGLSRLMSYVNPIIILQSASLLMIFSKISLNVNRTINFVAKSSFAVYLLHDCSKYEESLMVRAVNIISENFNDVAYFGVILACIVAIYFIAVSIDQLRIFSWNKIKSSLSRVLDKDILY